MSIFPNIQGVHQISELHLMYAEFVLNHMLKKLQDLEEVEIGIENDRISVIGFYGDTDDLEMHLLYEDRDFKVRVLEHSDQFKTGQFIYNLTSNEMDNVMPENIEAAMKDASFENEPRTLKLGGIQID